MREVRVGVRDLKARLSHYLGETKSGRTIIVTERGRPIARIIPEGETIESRMQKLIAKGFIQWSGKRLEVGEPVAVNRGRKLLSDIILENRR